MNRNHPKSQKKRLPSKMLYIGNLNYKITEDDLKGIFGRYAKVGKVKVIIDPKTQKSKGIAFVEVFGDIGAKKAIAELNESRLDGRIVKVSMAKERNPEALEKEKITREVMKEKLHPKKKKKANTGLDVLFANTSATYSFKR